VFCFFPRAASEVGGSRRDVIVNVGGLADGGADLSLRSVAGLDEFLVGRLDDEFGDNDVFGKLGDGDDEGGNVLGVDHAGFLFVGDFDGAFIEDGGVDLAGKDAGDADAILRFLGIDGGGHAGDSEFRGRVGHAGEGVSAFAGDGGDVENEAILALAHRGEGGVDEIEEAGAVDREELVEVVGVDLADLAFGDIDASGVDEDIGRTEFGDEGVDFLAVRNVAGFDGEIVARDGLEFFEIASADRDGGSGCGEGAGGAESDAAASAGDESSFS